VYGSQGQCCKLGGKQMVLSLLLNSIFRKLKKFDADKLKKKKAQNIWKAQDNIVSNSGLRFFRVFFHFFLLYCGAGGYNVAFAKVLTIKHFMLEITPLLLSFIPPSFLEQF
jgi:hypothetical protein